MESCPGCLVEFGSLDGPTHRYIGASPACWALYAETLAAPTWLGQLGVDAYAAQHPGVVSAQATQSVAVHLIALFATLRRGLSVSDVIDVRTKTVELRREGLLDLRWLDPRPTTWTSTLSAVVAGVPVRAWVKGVLDDWAIHHEEQLASWTTQTLTHL